MLNMLLLLPLLLLCYAGRAAQRLQEVVSSCGYDAPASTIHRLLGYRGRKTRASSSSAASTAADSVQLVNSRSSGLGGSAQAAAAAGGDDELDLGGLCEYGQTKKLPASKLLVDECSMMDLSLAAALLNAVA
jgi:hypothetical protein